MPRRPAAAAPEQHAEPPADALDALDLGGSLAQGGEGDGDLGHPAAEGADPGVNQEGGDGSELGQERALRREVRDPRALVANPRNARTHPEEQIGQLVALNERYGFTGSVLIRDDGPAPGEIIAGHGRTIAAVRAGLAEVPVVVADGWTDAEVRAYMLADNQVAANAGWDEELLRLELGELRDDGFDLALTGFSAAFLEGLDAPPAEAPAAVTAAEARAAGMGALAARFGVPPFSVLNAREGWWQDRKRAWISLGIKSEIGRGGGGRIFSEGDPLDGHNKGLTPAKGLRKSSTGGYTRKDLAGGRAFGQDLLEGENPNLVPQYGQSGRRSTKGGYKGTNGGNGVLMTSTPVTDQQFYKKKRIAEAELGRKLSNDEFMAEHYVPDTTPQGSGTSIFDPVLCELVYRWFSPAGATVLDPFAGGSVRGVVASVLGRDYVGVDLRPEQVEANEGQAREICEGRVPPTWHVGDAAEVVPALPVEADLVFSCPPYGSLEVYSDDPADLSTMKPAAFSEVYRAVIRAAVAKLRRDRFACFVVGDYRDKAGFYSDFVGATVRAFEDAGARLYNEAILVTAAGSLPMRTTKQFQAGRKMGKTHQNVLVFCKGNPQRATAYCGPVEFGEIEAEPEA